MPTEYMTEDVVDVDGLIAAAQRQKDGAKPASKNAKSKPGRKPRASKPAKSGSGSKAASASSKPKAKRKAKATPKVTQPPTPSKPGLVTVGVSRTLDGITAARSFGLWNWAAIAALVVVGTMSVASSMRAPSAAPLQGIRFEGVRVPTLLQEQWLRGFHRFDQLRRMPDRVVLDEFAVHLSKRPSVAGVEVVELVWRERPGQDPIREVSVGLSLRQPVLPVMLARGQRAWVDRDGVVLSPLLDGPKGEPVVRGYEEGGVAAMKELLTVWPQLREELPKGLVTEVYLDHPLGTAQQRGIVFVTRPGTKLIWGQPNEDRFGLSRERKIRNLVHTLSCQGDLSKVDTINVRFPDPFAKDPRLGS
ncbi:MAG: hypothetical protein PF961_06210 [Planctomycetota bacterium]|jgi:hypothetical protein|nr:hypothetical protein [Planctomycetota bacterium]